MNQVTYLSQALWQLRTNGHFTDLTLVCEDGSISTHSALLGKTFARFGLKFHCIEDVPDFLIVPGITTSEMEKALKTLYFEHKSGPLEELFKQVKHDVKLEVEETEVELKPEDLKEYEHNDVPSDDDNDYDPGPDMSDNEEDIKQSLKGELDSDKDWKQENNSLPDTKTFGTDTPSKRGSGKFQCNMCDIKLMTGESYRRHKYTRHEQEEEDVWRDWEALQAEMGIQVGTSRKGSLEVGKKRIGRPKGSKGSQYTMPREIECKLCGEVCDTRADMAKHKKERHRAKSSQNGLENTESRPCPYCSKIIKPISWNSHIALKHREETIENHPEIELTTPCEECDEMFFGKQDLDKHSLALHGKSIMEWKCTKCGETFPTANDRKFHMKKEHKELTSKKEECPYCDKAFKANLADGQKLTGSYMDIHIFNKHQDKRHLHPEIEVRYTCAECDEKFHDSQSLNTHHRNNHTGPSTCTLCSQVCQNEEVLRRHMAKHASEGVFICDLCSKEFKTKVLLNIHVKRVHHKISKWQNYKFNCTECNKGKYQTEEALQQHILDNHSGLEYMCAQCPKAFPNRDARSHHEKKQHAEKTFQCDQCDEMFSTNGHLNSHVAKIHVKEKNKICPHCGEAFHHGNSFKAHVLRHTDSRQFSCEECGKAYLLERDLKNHMKLHTLPYHCEQCDVRKGSAFALKNHVRKVHEGLMVSCRHGCGWQTGEMGNRNRHENQCARNPIPGAPFSISNGTASVLTLQKYNARMK